LEITRKALGEENAHYARYLLQKGEVDIIKNDYAAAEQEGKTVLRIYTGIFGEHNTRLLDPLELLDTLYTKTGNQAAQWAVANRLRQLRSSSEEEIPTATKHLAI
jgi:hypothetical protein